MTRGPSHGFDRQVLQSQRIAVDLPSGRIGVLKEKGWADAATLHAGNDSRLDEQLSKDEQC